MQSSFGEHTLTEDCDEPVELLKGKITPRARLRRKLYGVRRHDLVVTHISKAVKRRQPQTSLSPQRGEGLRALPLKQEYLVNVLCVQSKYNLLLPSGCCMNVCSKNALSFCWPWCASNWFNPIWWSA